MSQELIGACGAAVGSDEYFYRINQGTLLSRFLPTLSEYQYSVAFEQLSGQCAAVIDEIYSDLQNAAPIVPDLSPEHKENLIRLIGNLEETVLLYAPTYTNAGGCLQLLSIEELTEQGSILGIWGMDIGSYSYMQSKCSAIFPSSLIDPLTSISQMALSDLAGIADQIASDIDTGINQHHYIRDENGDALRRAIHELKRCNYTMLSLDDSKVKDLCWYHGISRDEVAALQKALNKLPGFDILTEDGVYGEKTSSTYRNFLDILAHGAFPSLTFIDPLQSASTGVQIRTKTTKSGQAFSQIFMDGTKWPIFRADRHRFGADPDFPHINVSSTNHAPAWQKSIADSLDHRGISEKAYDVLKNFDDTAKIVKAGGRVLLVAGIVIDAVELGNAIQTDLNDADQKLGKTTVSAGMSIIGSWGGGALGAKFGAYIGAGIGTAIFPGVGTLIGGAVGGLALGIAGSAGGSALGEWVVEITDIWEQ